MTTVPHLFQGKRVLEIGCGHGLLGILAAKLGAREVCLQDFNAEVIERLTKATVAANEGSEAAFSFLHGDWAELKCLAEPYDVVLGSELTYCPQNYAKLVRCLETFTKQSGCCLLANKTYYFGVGGTMVAFKKRLAESGKLQCESVALISPEKGGNKK